MSDIPVGSPPVPPGRHAAPGGWYPDPLDPVLERYWDGWQWSRNTRTSEAPPLQRSRALAPQPPARPGGPAYGMGPAQPYAVGPTMPRPVLLTADGVPVATWWWRALAALLDGLITGTVWVLLSLPLYRGVFSAAQAWWVEAYRIAQAGGQPPPTPNLAAMISTTDQLLIALVALAVGMAYHVPFLRLRGATPGKQVCGLRVVPAEQGQSRAPLPWGTAVVRSALWVVPGALSLRILTVADVLVPLWQPRRQALHDIIAKTQVVKVS